MHEAVGCSLLLGTMPAMERAPGLPGSPWQGLAAAAHSRTPGPGGAADPRRDVDRTRLTLKLACILGPIHRVTVA